ncbi:hypothetical protein D3C71_344330 [compost metagenome]
MKLENYHKPTPYHLKVLGDLAIMLIPILTAAIPSAPIQENSKYWIMLGCNCSLVIFKFITKLYSDDK